MLKLKNCLGLCLILLLVCGCDALPFIDLPINTRTPLPSPSAEINATTTPTAIVLESFTPDPTQTLPLFMSTATETPTPVLAPRFQVQEGNPLYLENFVHQADGCKWMGIAGQVFDESGQAIIDLMIISGNAALGKTSELAAITGLAPGYGPGGYEMRFSDTPFESNDIYWVQIFNSDGQPLSDPFFFNTTNACDQNLILINFVPAVN